MQATLQQLTAKRLRNWGHRLCTAARSAASKSGLGARGERIAGRFLERRGYLILKLNWRCKKGEIDLVAIRDRTLVFTEVKTRWLSAQQIFNAIEAVDDEKREQLRKLASWYVHVRERDLKMLRIKAVRLDLIIVTLRGPLGLVPAVEHYENAIGFD